ncbi:MAG TPA: glycosyltransferase family 4 protein [Solirubrobacterales bacterium]|nr:glycosyltransferase family 4 protein [Solirubrobacterales bacterium]
MSPPSPALRALIVTDYYRPLIGGSIRSVELLARHLTAAGHTVAIATSWQPGMPSEEEREGIPVYRVRDLSSRMRWVSEDPYKHNPPPFADPEAAWRLRRVVKDFQPDLVHTYGWISHSLAVGLLGRKVPLLLSARDYGNVCAVGTLVRKGELCSGPALGKCLDCARHRYGAPKGVAAVIGVFAVGPVLRRKVTALHAVSRFVARIIDRFLHVPGIPATVIPNFHEEEPGEAVDAEAISQLPEQPFILFVGGFREIKGIYELFEAYESLVDPPPLVLVGTMMSDSPKEFPAGSTVITDVSHATVMAIWEQALFGVLPTKAPEALGNVVHEAMSKGRAMIGTRPGGQEDMIEDGETGLLVPGGDATALAAAMRRLIEDRELRERIEVKARDRARAFTPEVVMPQIESLYQRTAARSGSPA